MAGLSIYIQDYLIITSSIITIIIAVYSLFESLRNKRKFNQLNKETLVSKVATDFEYKTEKIDDKKILKGKITFLNKGTTNIKVVELNFDVKDRADEFEKAFIPKTPEEKFNTNSEGVHTLDLIGFNNSKQLSFNNPSDKYFQIFRSDSAYVFPNTHKLRNYDMDENLKNFIEKKVNQVYGLFTNYHQNKDEIVQILIGDILIREIRGFQLFPGESMTQEFVASYAGSGSIILNVEASSLRFLQQSVTKGDEFKALVDECMDSEQMDESAKTRMISLLKESLQPSSNDIMDHRKTFLMYLP